MLNFVMEVKFFFRTKWLFVFFFGLSPGLCEKLLKVCDENLWVGSLEKWTGSCMISNMIYIGNRTRKYL